MTRRINSDGLRLIKQWEGLKLSSYKDVAGIWTIGYGSTGPHVKPNMKITEAQAEKLLKDDLDRFEKRVDTLVKVPLTDNQFSALVSFDFNTGALHSSTLLKKLNQKKYDEVPNELMKYVKATINGSKQTVKGLVNRRSAEIGLWAKGSFVSSNTVAAEKKVETKDVTVIAATGASGAGATVLPEVPAIVDAVSNQRDELTSGQWFRIAIAVLIIGLTFYGIYRKVKS